MCILPIVESGIHTDSRQLQTISCQVDSRLHLKTDAYLSTCSHEQIAQHCSGEVCLCVSV